MELKVWVEGIQRIVCGVNEKTTCQDVVFALAHATGKTGRFTLIERWRNSERLLAPNEQPLKVLLKWGEHSNDVQFILQWSPLDSSSSLNKSGQLQSGKSHAVGGVESSCSDNSSSHSPSPLSKSNKPYAGSPSLSSGISGGVLSPLSQVNGPIAKKPSNSGSSSSYTSNVSSDSRLGSSFSQNGPDGLIHNIITPENQQNGESSKMSVSSGILRGLPTRLVSNDTSAYSSNSASGKLIENGSISMQSLGKLVDPKLSSPPPYREPPSPASHYTPPLITSPSGMNSPGTKSLPPYRDPPPPNLSHLPSYINKPGSGNSPVSATIGNNLTGNQPSVFNLTNVSSVHSNNDGGINGGMNSGYGTSNVPNHKDSPRYSAISSNLNPQQESLSSLSSGNDASEAWKHKDHNMINGDIPSNQNGSISKPSSLSSPPNPSTPYRDLIRVVNSQREKLTSQQADLTQYDAEIMFWEGKAREQQRHMDLINKEISRLEVVSAQHDSQVLSLAHLEEENEYTQRESAVLKSEMNNLRAELEKCDTEIEQCKKRIRLLVDELHLTQNQMAQRQEEWMQKESSTLAEIDRLRRELDIARRETEAVNDLSGSLDQEVQSIETSLTEKKKQMERLVAAMKEANLQSLSIQPPDELIEAHHRSGSTRRMIGSPRQLENAAPTSKNPHGVWV